MGILRWKVVATYRSEAGPIDVTHEVEELFEVHNLIERGPDWNALASIRITLATPACPGMTLEEAAKVGEMTIDEYHEWIAQRRTAA